MWHAKTERLAVLARHVALPAAATAEAPPGDDTGSTQRRLGPPHPGRTLTDEEKRALYHDGYVVVNGVVSPEAVVAMYRSIEDSSGEALTRVPHAPIATREVFVVLRMRGGVSLILLPASWFERPAPPAG